MGTVTRLGFNIARSGIIRPRWPFCANLDSPKMQSCVGWWPSGLHDLSQAYDLSGRGLHLPVSASGMGYHLDHEMGPVWDFEDTYYFRTTSGVPVTSPPFTFLWWVYEESTTGNGYCGGISGDSWPDTQDVMEPKRGYLGEPNYNFYSEGNDVSLSPSGDNNSTGSWIYYCCTHHSQTDHRLYAKNENVDLSATNSTTTTTFDISTTGITTIGVEADTTPGNFIWEDYIAEMLVLNRGISQKEFRAWYDPSLRWDHYHELGRRSFFGPAETVAGAAAAPTGVLSGPLVGPLGGPI